MVGERTSRRPLVVQDENAISTRLTRAKAAANADLKPAVSLGAVANQRRRAAFGEVSKNKLSTSASSRTGIEGKPAISTVTSSNKREDGVLANKSNSASNIVPVVADLKARHETSTGLRDITKRQHFQQGGRTTSKRPKVFDERVLDEEKENDLNNHHISASVNKTRTSIQSDRILQPLELNTKSSVSPPQASLINLKGIDYTWEDLDAGESDDPLMVSEYVDDIFNHLWVLETQYLPNPSYLKDVQDNGITWRARGILIDWLVEVHAKFRLAPETLFLAVNLVDRYFSRIKTSLSKIQLVGVASLFIASKYEEVYCPSIHSLSFIAEGFTDEQIINMEREILSKLNFDIGYPNPMNFLRRISKADDYDMETRTVGKYLLEISILDHRLLQYTPSILSASAMFLARMILGRSEWNGNFMRYSGYPEHDLYPIVNVMIDYIGSRVVHEAFFKKYASRKFLKASIVCRSWVKQMLADKSQLVETYKGYTAVEEQLMG